MLYERAFSPHRDAKMGSRARSVALYDVNVTVHVLSHYCEGVAVAEVRGVRGVGVQTLYYCHSGNTKSMEKIR